MKTDILLFFISTKNNYKNMMFNTLILNHIYFLIIFFYQFEIKKSTSGCNMKIENLLKLIHFLF